MLVGVDGSAISEAAIAFAFEEASWRGLGLTVIHAWQTARMPVTFDVAEATREAAEERVLAESLAGWSERYPDVQVMSRLVRDHPAPALMEESMGAALLVLGSHARGRRGDGGRASRPPPARPRPLCRDGPRLRQSGGAPARERLHRDRPQPGIEEPMRHQSVQDVMTKDVVAVESDTPYKQIAEILAEHKISGVPVVDSEAHVLGVVSEADLLAKAEYPEAERRRRLLDRPGTSQARRRASAGVARDLMTAPAVPIGDRPPVVGAAKG